MKHLHITFLILISFLYTTKVIAQDSYLKTGYYYVTSSSKEGVKRSELNTNEDFYIIPTPILLAQNITRTDIKKNNFGYYILIMYFDKTASKDWSIATKNSINKQLAFIINNELILVSKVNSQITNGVSAINSELYSKEELEQFRLAIISKQHK